MGGCLVDNHATFPIFMLSIKVFRRPYIGCGQQFVLDMEICIESYAQQKIEPGWLKMDWVKSEIWCITQTRFSV